MKFAVAIGAVTGVSAMTMSPSGVWIVAVWETTLGPVVALGLGEATGPPPEHAAATRAMAMTAVADRCWNIRPPLDQAAAATAVG
jgi:hypothetical protein